MPEIQISPPSFDELRREIRETNNAYAALISEQQLTGKPDQVIALKAERQAVLDEIRTEIVAHYPDTKAAEKYRAAGLDPNERTPSIEIGISR